MKLWIEKDSENDVYLHTKEPEPILDEHFWESSDASGQPLIGENAEFFRKRLKPDTVATFELICIWERVGK